MSKLIMAVGAAFLLVGCGPSPAARPAATVPEVEVTAVQQRDVPIYGEWVGTVDGLVNAAIKPQVSGYLVHQLYEEGTFVHKGQMLFEIDARSFQAQLAQSEGHLAQARGQEQQARSLQTEAEAGVQQAQSSRLQAEAALAQAAGQLAEAQAARAQAAANQAKTEADVKRYQPLAAQKAVTDQDLENAVQTNKMAAAQVAAADAQIKTVHGRIAAAQAQIAAARSALTAAQAKVGTASASIVQAQAQQQTTSAEVRQAELNLEFTRVVSPIDGIAGVSRAQVGDLVSPGGEPLTTVSTVDPIKVNFTLSESDYLESLKYGKGQRRVARYKLIQADGSEYPREGKFHSQDRNLSVNTGAIRVTVTFPNPDHSLRPGQYARVRAVKYVEKQALVIPQRAINELQDRVQVAVVGADNKVDVRQVKLGERVEKTNWIIKEGLKAGDRVVTEGVQKATAGATVKVKRK